MIEVLWCADQMTAMFANQFANEPRGTARYQHHIVRLRGRPSPRGFIPVVYAATEGRPDARVDFRVDPTGAPFIIDVNPNPYLTPDTEDAAARQRLGSLTKT
jgi:hypothetical protein